MLDFMDDIAESTEEFARAAAAVAIWLLITTVKVAILITAPVWLLPYKMLREKNNGKCEKPDCNSCPFPPCEKGEAEND